jgi:hypothetical protein
LIEAMRRDKKRRGNAVRFILLGDRTADIVDIGYDELEGALDDLHQPRRTGA